jgi:hypothetical protein
MITCLHRGNDHLFHAYHFGRGALRRGASLFASHGAKLSARNAPLELRARMAVTELLLTAVENRLENRSFILARRTLEDMVASLVTACFAVIWNCSAGQYHQMCRRTILSRR